MITIYDSADMARVLSGPIDPDLKTILLERLELLAETKTTITVPRPSTAQRAGA